jgi:hypothetical protein
MAFLLMSVQMPHEPGGGQTQTDAGEVLVDEEYKTACGPISCFVALHKLGDDTPLRTIIDESSWKKDQPVPFSALLDTLSRHSSVRARAVRLTPEELLSWMAHGDRVAILAIRKMPAQTDHALCAIGVEGERLAVLDYPELDYTLSKGRLSDMWNGEAILVVPNETPWAVYILEATVPGVVVGLILIGFARRRKGTALARESATGAVPTPHASSTAAGETL